ncbi:MAG: hypothetical protein R2813_03900 [Flavobacteriales bacterium]
MKSILFVLPFALATVACGPQSDQSSSDADTTMHEPAMEEAAPMPEKKFRYDTSFVENVETNEMEMKVDTIQITE